MLPYGDFESDEQARAFYAWQHVKNRQDRTSKGESWEAWWRRMYGRHEAALRARLEAE